MVGSFPSERIATAVTRPPFSGDMEDYRLSVTVAERRGSANVLHGQDFVPSSNPRGDDAPQILVEHIRRSPRGSAFSTDRTLHSDLDRPRLHTILPHYDQHSDIHCGLAYPLYTTSRYAWYKTMRVFTGLAPPVLTRRTRQCPQPLSRSCLGLATFAVSAPGVTTILGHLSIPLNMIPTLSARRASTTTSRICMKSTQ